jgi:TIR domain-containing protein
MTKTPKVFISYSHDTPPHKQWVASLAVRLRQNGVDAVLDQWDLFPGEDVPVFMERNLSDCNYALLICTKRYVEKANSGEGGVGYEKMIVSSEMIKNMDVGKFIPIIRQAGTHEVPIFIKTKLFLDFSADEDFEIVFDELLRTIFRSALQKKPPLGAPPKIVGGRVQQTESKIDLPEHAHKLFIRLVRLHDTGSKTWWKVDELIDPPALGRVAVEAGLVTLKSKGYVTQDKDRDWVLTESGKAIAIENGIVKL